MAHQEVAQAVILRVRTELDLLAKVEAEPTFDGRQMVMILAPR
jgi:translation initiation factor IF-3